MDTLGTRIPRPSLSFDLTGRDAKARRLFAMLATIALVVGAAVWVRRLADYDEAYRLAVDYNLYVGAIRDWLAGGPFYRPEHIAAPFDASFTGAILYPPTAIPFLVPFAYLPWPLWWGIPMSLGIVGVLRLRPAPWTWPIIALFAIYHQTVWLVLSGNPVVWGFAGLAWLELGWPTLFFFLKPSLGPLAFLGIRRRSWWIGVAILTAIALAFLPLWSDWLAVIQHAENGRAGFLYSVYDLPFVLIPLVAWAGRKRAAG